MSEFLAAFLDARLCEEEAHVRRMQREAVPIPIYSGDPEPAEYVPDPRPAWLLREIAVKRGIVSRYNQLRGYADRPYDAESNSHDAIIKRRGYLHALEVVIREFAALYDSHPGYDQEWAP